MPREHEFGPKCRQLLEEHGLTDLFVTDSCDAPEGQLYKPPPTPGDVIDKFADFLEELFAWFGQKSEPPSPYGPNRP